MACDRMKLTFNFMYDFLHILYFCMYHSLYVCVCIYMYACVCVCVYVCLYVCIYLCIYVMYICNVSMYAYIVPMYISMYVQMFV